MKPFLTILEEAYRIIALSTSGLGEFVEIFGNTTHATFHLLTIAWTAVETSGEFDRYCRVSLISTQRFEVLFLTRLRVSHRKLELVAAITLDPVLISINMAVGERAYLEVVSILFKYDQELQDPHRWPELPRNLRPP